MMVNHICSTSKTYGWTGGFWWDIWPDFSTPKVIHLPFTTPGFELQGKFSLESPKWNMVNAYKKRWSVNLQKNNLYSIGNMFGNMLCLNKQPPSCTGYLSNKSHPQRSRNKKWHMIGKEPPEKVGVSCGFMNLASPYQPCRTTDDFHPSIVELLNCGEKRTFIHYPKHSIQCMVYVFLPFG